MQEFRLLLDIQENPLVKVVLNGGGTTLDSATVPFTIGIDESIAKNEPTHVLVIDIPYKLYKDMTNDTIYVKRPVLKQLWDEGDEAIMDFVPTPVPEEQPITYSKLSKIGERRLYELNTINYMQFHSPGEHNLIFLLLSYPDRNARQTLLQQTNLRNAYDHSISIDNINSNYYDYIVGSCEAQVTIPEVFFASSPDTGFKKYWHKWVNRWFTTRPTDECVFRKRAILATTLQPVCWTFGFVPRLVHAAVFNVVALIVNIFLFMFIGYQRTARADYFQVMNIDFLFLFRKATWTDSWNCWDELFNKRYWQEFKVYRIGKNYYNLIITPGGLMIQLIAWIVFGYYSWDSVANTAPGSAFTSWLFVLFSFVVGVVHLSFVISKIPDGKSSDILNNFMNHKATAFTAVGLLALTLVGYITMQFVYHHAGMGDWFVNAWHNIRHFGKETGHVAKNVGGTVGSFLLAKILWASLVAIILTRIFFWKKIGPIVKGSHKTVVGFWSRSMLRTWISKKYKQYQENRIKRLEKEEQEQKSTRESFLLENMSLDALPAQVDVSHVVAETKTKTAILGLKVVFYGAKAKVCKPYAK